MLANEVCNASEIQVKQKILNLWHVMDRCIKRGFNNEGELPGRAKSQKKGASNLSRLN